MSDLEAAAQRLRDSVAAVAERTNDAGAWYSRTGEVRTVAEDTEGSGGARGWLLIQAYDRAADQPIVDHIATTASPPTVTLLADLLTAIDSVARERGWFSPTIALAADALASAILHTDQHDGSAT